MKIKDIPKENRPRERVKTQGIDSLSDAEIIALLLSKGNKDENVVEMANRLLREISVDKLSESSLNELQKVKGIGEVKAMQLLASFELGRRAQRRQLKKISCPEDVFNHCKSRMSHLQKEEFRVLLLDSKKRIVKEETVSVGTINASLVHPREVFRSAIRENADGVIVVHNHPSGDPAPSEQDKQVTEWLTEAGKIIGIKVVDHVIIGRESFYSFS